MPDFPHSPNEADTVYVPPDDFYDLVVIGGGPHSLALAARLSEQFPAALYTDDEHQRLTWLKKYESESVNDAKKRTTRELRLQSHQAFKDSAHASEPVHAGEANRRNITLQRAPGRRKGEPHFIATPSITGCPPSRTLRVAKPLVERPSPGATATVSSSSPSGHRMAVFDKHSSSFMGTWNAYFEALEIAHLRSPMFFHPDPADLDGLLAYADRTGRNDELLEIEGVVGQELSKHAKKKKRCQKCFKTGGEADINERFRRDYYSPSAALFRDYCASIEEKHDLAGLVRQGQVECLDYMKNIQVEGAAGPPCKAFMLKIRIGSSDSYYSIAARAVVLALGPGGAPNIPRSLSMSGAAGAPKGPASTGPGWCHTSAFLQKSFVFPPQYVKERMGPERSTTMLVIGGGLTSAQVADLALRRGVDKVYLLCRGHLKVKHFDVDLQWMGKYSNMLKMIFWMEDEPSERISMIRSARGGGSVNYVYHKVLQKHVKAGCLDILTHSELHHCSWDEHALAWNVHVTQKPEALRRAGDVVADCERIPVHLPPIDYIVSATGAAPNLPAQPFLQAFQSSMGPIKHSNGLPLIDDDLQVICEGSETSPGLANSRDDSAPPLFVLGALAGYQLGPGAGNLGGAREGAERIARRLESIWKEDGRIARETSMAAEMAPLDMGEMGSTQKVPPIVSRSTWTHGRGNRYAAFGSGNTP